MSLTNPRRANPYYTHAAIGSLSTITHQVAEWPSAHRRLILIAEGQSNFAQYYDSIYTPTHVDKQFEFLISDGTLRRFVEQIFGNASAPLVGSLHGKLGDDIIDAGLADSIVWIPVAIGGTPISFWASRGQYTTNLLTALNRLSNLGLGASAILTMRGEADCFLGTSQESYFASASEQIAIARRAGFTGKWYVSQMSYFKSGGMSFTSAAVIAAQQQLAAEVDGVYEGPSLDDLGDDYRFLLDGTDYTHFNGTLGRNTVSSRWVTALEANPPGFT